MIRSLFKQGSLVVLSLVACVFSASATAQDYTQYTQPPYDFYAYQPVLVGGKVTATSMATTSTSQGTAYCTYLYKNGISVGGHCGWVNPSNTPAIQNVSSQCNPGYTITWQTRVRRVGTSWWLNSPLLTVRCP